LARHAGLDTQVTGKLTIPGGAGFGAAAKVASIVAGMIAGADSIDDRQGLREGAVGKLMPGVRAPSTLGTFMRAFTFGHVRQLGAAAAAMLTWMCAVVDLLGGQHEHRDTVTWLDVDDHAGNLWLRQTGRRLRLQQGERPECVVGHGVHHHQHPGDRRAPAPRRGAQRGPRLREVPGRCDRRGPPRRCHHDDPVPAGLGLLQPQGDRCDPHRESGVLHHRPDGPSGPVRNRRDHRRRVGVYQISAGDLGRRSAPVDLRCASR
jgi:hypothetical protein